MMAIITSVCPYYQHVATGLPPHLPAHVTNNGKQLKHARVIAGEHGSKKKKIQCSTVQHQPPGPCFVNNYGSISSRFSRNCSRFINFKVLCQCISSNVPDFSSHKSTTFLTMHTKILISSQWVQESNESTTDGKEQERQTKICRLVIIESGLRLRRIRNGYENKNQAKK